MLFPRLARHAPSCRSRHIPALAAAALLGFVFCGPAIAHQTSAAGDGGAPSAFKPGLVYDGAAFANLGGGVRLGGTYTNNLNLQLNVDAAALSGWPNTIAYLDALWLQGGLPSSFIRERQHLRQHGEALRSLSSEELLAKPRFRAI